MISLFVNRLKGGFLMVGFNIEALRPSHQSSKEDRKDRLESTRMTSYYHSMGSDIHPLPLAGSGHVFTPNEKRYLSEKWKNQYPEKEESGV